VFSGGSGGDYARVYYTLRALAGCIGTRHSHALTGEVSRITHSDARAARLRRMLNIPRPTVVPCLGAGTLRPAVFFGRPFARLSRHNTGLGYGSRLKPDRRVGGLKIESQKKSGFSNLRWSPAPVSALPGMCLDRSFWNDRLKSRAPGELTYCRRVRVLGYAGLRVRSRTLGAPGRHEGRRTL